MSKLTAKKAQSILEYVIVFAVIVAAITWAAIHIIDPAIKHDDGYVARAANVITAATNKLPH